jgi:GT2 family glycosyltransferase
MVSLIVSTVGRPEALRELLESVVAATSAAGDIEVIVVDQSEDLASKGVLESQAWPFAWTHTTSGRGVSTGRNAGVALATGEVVGFPDDDCIFDPGVLDGVMALLSHRSPLQGVCLPLVGWPSGKGILRFPAGATTVDERTVYRTVMSAGLYVRRSLLQEVGPFDEGLGAGSPGPFGAGEETDLVLRCLRAGARLEFRPGHLVRHPDPPAATTEQIRRERMYGYGIGEVMRRWNTPWTYVLGLAVRRAAKTAVMLLRRRPSEALSASTWALAILRGRAGLVSQPHDS